MQKPSKGADKFNFSNAEFTGSIAIHRSSITRIYYKIIESQEYIITLCRVTRIYYNAALCRVSIGSNSMHIPVSVITAQETYKGISRLISIKLPVRVGAIDPVILPSEEARPIAVPLMAVGKTSGE